MNRALRAGWLVAGLIVLPAAGYAHETGLAHSHSHGFTALQVGHDGAGHFDYRHRYRPGFDHGYPWDHYYPAPRAYYPTRHYYVPVPHFSCDPCAYSSCGVPTYYGHFYDPRYAPGYAIPAYGYPGR